MDIEIKIPDIGIETVEVIEIFVKIGDKIKKNDSLITVEGQKVSMEIPSSKSGIIQSIFVQVGQKVKSGSLILSLSNSSKNHVLQNNKKFYLDNLEYDSKRHFERDIFIEDNSLKEEKLVHATPIIRRLARKLDINLSHVIGSGRKGRIIKEDISAYVQNKSIQNKKNINVKHKSEEKSIQGSYDKLKKSSELWLTNIQKASSKHLCQSWSVIPHVTQFDEADITNLEKFRKDYNIKLSAKKSDLKLTILVFVIKVVAKSLKSFPRFNSILCPNTKKKLILNKDINIGIAVDTNDGLLVPVIRNADKKDIIDLLLKLNYLSKKAKSKTLDVIDTTNGNFTISNLGGIGGTNFTPIINYPEVAILGISKAFIKSHWNGKEFKPHLMLPLSLSYDHRVVDGAEAARFITLISEMLSDIRLLIV
ncbi:MAG: 2-oxo acid dehydrogenase subunit E2 [Buchnera aphidicola (Nurudea yanoniella)]